MNRMLNMNSKRDRAGMIFLLSGILVMGAFPAFAQNASVPVQPESTLQVSTLSESSPANTDGTAQAGTPDAPDTVDAPEIQLSDTTLIATADAKRHVRDGSVLPESLTTLFFTAWQHALLQEAKIGFNTALSGEPGNSAGAANRDPGIREISLGGIAFANAEKWTVWLNGVRVTPAAIPQQVLDIKVTQTYIDLKWFDNYTNKIYPIRLRPQERFNLDTRIFLPGTTNPDSAL
jgi:hypothetical protein